MWGVCVRERERERESEREREMHGYILFSIYKYQDVSIKLIVILYGKMHNTENLSHFCRFVPQIAMVMNDNADPSIYST